MRDLLETTLAEPTLSPSQVATTGHEPSPFATLLTWETACIFAGFVLITLVWEFVVAVSGWGTVATTGRKPLWVFRLKEEVLALGVVTLCLTIFEASLATICIPGFSGDHGTPEEPEAECPEGHRLLFPKHKIKETHLLLFTLAVVHIFCSCTCLYLCLFRMRRWRGWERNVKDGLHVDIAPDYLVEQIGISTRHHYKRIAINMFSHIKASTYTLLRLLFKLRMDEATTNSIDRLPRQFNFLNVVQQNVELRLSEAAKHTWMLTAGMAVFLVMPERIHALWWLGGLSIITYAIIAAKLQSLLAHMGGIAYFDFYTEIQAFLAEYTEHERAGDNGSDANDAEEDGIKAEKGKPAGFTLVANTPPPPPLLSVRDNGLLLIKPSKVLPLGQAPSGRAGPAQSETPFEDYRHRVQYHLKHPVSGKVETGSHKGLFWLKKPDMLLYVFQLGMMETAMSLTLICYGLVRDRVGTVRDERLGPVIAILILNIMLLVFGACWVLPVYALVITVATDKPKRLLMELRTQKLVTSEGEAFEEGVGGVLLRAVGLLAKEEASEEAEEGPRSTGSANDYFIYALADQAGVITARTFDMAQTKRVNSLFICFGKAWRQMSQTWVATGRAKGKTTAPPISDDLRDYQEEFDVLDRSRKDLISDQDLAWRLRTLGTRVTLEERKDMVAEVNSAAGNETPKDGVQFQEMLLFMIYKFFDQNDDGFLTPPDIVKAMVMMGWEPLNETEPRDWIELIEAIDEDDDDERPGGRIELDEFIQYFREMQITSKTDPSDKDGWEPCCTVRPHI